MSTEPEHWGTGGPGTVGFGELLRAWRERALLTQEQLADRSRLSVRTIRSFERGPGVRRPQSASLRQLAAALGLDAEEQAILVEAARAAPIPVRRFAQAGAVARRSESRPSAVADPSTRQLPPPPPQFTGRAADLAALEDERGQTGTVIIAIDGMAGIGKTALAVHAAHRWSSHYPDGQIFLDLQGYTRDVSPVEPGDALHRLLRALGIPGAQIPDDLNDRAALYRSRLAGRRVLVLLDNAASEAQVIPLLPGTGDCLVMITSRQRLVGLDLTHAHSLDLLPPDDAVTLFVRSSGGRGARAEPPGRLTEAVELCGRLPLAIRIAAARLRSRPSWTADHLVDRLRSLRHRLAELEAGDRSVTAALELSYVQLDPDLRYIYRMLGLHPGLDLDLDAVAALTGRPAMHVRRLLDHLLDAHLLQEPVPGRYRFHDLTRAHAARAASDEETEPDRRAALGRLFDHYCREARSAVVAVYPYERENRLGAASTTIEEPPPQDPVTAAAWVDMELANLLAVAEYALDALAAIGSIHRGCGRFEQADELYRQTLRLAREIGSSNYEFEALHGSGRLHHAAGRHQVALDHHQQALDLAFDLGQAAEQARAHDGIAHAQYALARPEQARWHWQRALSILAALGSERTEDMEVTTTVIRAHLERLEQN